MTTDIVTEQLDRDILALIGAGVHAPRDEAAFNALALRLFAYQFERNPVYGRFCQAKGRTPDTVRHWQDIPSVPAAAFKELPLACFPIERAAAVYESSGTTGAKRSRHYLETLDLYHASMLANFKACVLPDMDRMRMLVLMPPLRVLPRSSLGHMLEVVQERLGTAGSACYIDDRGLQAESLVRDLRAVETSGEPVALLGTAFSFVHFLDYCTGQRLRFSLPHKSRIMDTGGFKGKSREVAKEDLLRLYQDVLGVAAHSVVNEYGMSEMGSQFYDNQLASHLGAGAARHKLVPPWVRTVVVDAETLEPVPLGREGILRHVDLANRGSVMAIQTEDLGIALDDGFEVLGRAVGAEAKGCSIAVDELLRANA